MIPEKAKPAEDFIRIQDLLYIFISKWRWFALSIAIAIGLAVLYLAATPPVYTRTASILIKDNSKGGASIGGMGEFGDLDLFTSNSNVNNELITLKSPALMDEVVARLGLDKKYTVRRGLRKTDLYREAPVSVLLNISEEQPVAFDMELQSGGKVRLSGFTYLGNEYPGEITGALSDTLSTPAGPIVINPTLFYNDNGHSADLHFVKSSHQGVVNYYVSALQAILENKNATVITLSIKDPSILRAEDILSTLIAVYNENWIRDKNQIGISTSRFINERLNVIENELGDVDEDISSYKSAHILPDVNAVSGMYLSQYAENKRELQQLNNKLSIVEYIRGNLIDKSGDKLLPVNSGIDNANLEKQISEYNALLLQRNTLLSNSSERNPLVIDINRSLEGMSQGIIRSVDNLIVSLNTQVENVKRQEANVTGQIASNPDQARFLLSVERQQKVKESLYLYLLQKREENELSQAFTAYNTRIITPPYGSSNPTSPRRAFLFLIALMGGMLLPLAFFVVKERTDTAVRGRKDLEGMTIPFIGEIPYAQKKWNKKTIRRDEEIPVVVVKEKNRNLINEAFRVVRTNLEFMVKKEGRAKVFMVTSINPFSGKTFITMNLAAGFVIKGEKVLVIDLDIRKALLSRYVDSPKPGIADFLGHQADDWHSLIVKREQSDYPDVLPVGTIPPNPTELLFDSRLEQLLKELRNIYDYIFIDCPPVEIVADTSIINNYVDLTLFVVRVGLLERSILPEIEQFYTTRKYGNMTLLLNGTPQPNGPYQRYGTHYGYAYGANYTDNE